jgi:O-antigen/teichoic acid export membrane protein
MSATSVAVAREKPQPAVTTVAPPLRVAFTWTLAGNVVYAITQFGMLSALAKLGNPSVVGQYALALAVCAPIFMFTNLQLRGVQATDARNEYGFADYFTLRSLCTLLGLTVIGMITIFSRYDANTKWVIVLVALAKAVETFADVISGHLQKHERLDKVARALMIRGITSVLCFTAVFWLTRNLLAASVTLILSWGASIFLYDFRVAARLLGENKTFFHLSPPTLQRLVWLSLPLGVVMALNSLCTNIPRYILEHKLGTAELGIFASLAYLITAMGLIVIALGQSVCARLSRLFADGNIHSFKRMMAKLILFSAGLGIAGFLTASILGRTILTLVYKPEYAEHVNLLLVMVVDASISAIAAFLGFGMTAARCFRSQLPIMAATVSCTILFTFLLIPYFGLMGGGYALVISSTVQAGLSFLVLASATRKRVLA